MLVKLCTSIVLEEIHHMALLLWQRSWFQIIFVHFYGERQSLFFICFKPFPFLEPLWGGLVQWGRYVCLE